MSTPPISIGQAVSRAWLVFKPRFGLLAAIVLTFVGLWVLLEVIW